MKKLFALLFIVSLTFPFFAEERIAGTGNSYSEFPFIIFVGQIVDVTPFSVTFENTLYETRTTTEKIKNLFTALNRENDFRSHGMANALRAASVKDGKMRLTFYLDNIFLIFDDNVTTYMRYIPLYYLFRNNIEDFKLPEATMESLKKQSVDYYLTIPMVNDLMKNSWLAGVFQVNPDNDKLTYKSARFFDSIDELNNSEWAQEYRIPDIIRAGLTVSMTKAIFIGHESRTNSLKDTNLNSRKPKEKGKKQNKKQFDNRGNMPAGQEK
ncbi:hypothetical protein J5681_09745 [bacterium]|nr:hypothetical protein [bacterium]